MAINLLLYLTSLSFFNDMLFLNKGDNLSKRVNNEITAP